ncbi:MAG TPA: hypothetical protein VF031_05735 [Alphaproteobacteria bacterium]
MISAEVSAAEPVSRAAPLRPFGAPAEEPDCGRAAAAGRGVCAAPPDCAGLRAALAFFAAGLREALVREAAGLREDVAREALLRAALRAEVLFRAVRLAEDFAAVLRAPVALRAPPVALRAPEAALRAPEAALRAPVLVLRAGDFEAVDLRLEAVLRVLDLLALLLRAAARPPAFLPRLLEREPVVRAMVRHSMRLGADDRPI